jgi:hypothetical protein
MGIPMIAEPLPEMYAEMWQAGIQAVIEVPDQVAPVWPAAEEWAAEARRYRTESALVDDTAEAARLLLAAARAFEQAGDLEQAEAGVRRGAVARSERGRGVAGARALCREPREYDDAHALWARMATAVQAGDERASYGALSAEWTLARGGKLAAGGAPGDPGGTGARARASRGGASGGGAGRRGERARRRGTWDGRRARRALLDHAARCREAARDRVGATAERAEAAKLDPYAPPSLPARLRDAARVDDRKAVALVEELASGPEGVLSNALARWSASLATRIGDKKRAARCARELAPVTAAAARDRIDQEAAAGAPLDPASLERLRSSMTGAAGAVVLTWIEAGNLARRGETTGALALMGRVIAEQADAIPLGLLAQQIAADSNDPGDQASAFDLWLRADPGRRAEAALALADARQAAQGGEGGDPLAARGALQTAIEAAPGSALFWSVAASDARAGRQADAAATLSYGAEMWGPSALAPGLRVCAMSHLALGEPERAFENLQTRLAAAPDEPVTHPFELEARARLAERAGDAGALVIDAGRRGGPPPIRAVRRRWRRAGPIWSTSRPTAMDAPGSWERARGCAGDAAVLPLLLLDEQFRRTAAGEALWRAGDAAAGASAAPIARLYRLAASRDRGAERGRRRGGRPRVEPVRGAAGGSAGEAAVVRAAAASRPNRGARDRRIDLGRRGG